MNVYQQKLELTCKPLDSLSEIATFLQNPPAWRSLCKELTPHSPRKIKNLECNKHEGVSRFSIVDGPEVFCHLVDPDAEEVQQHDEKTLPKTLVCHDMANGYHDDSIIDGTGNYDAYTFYNWAGIDIFCYFSHHLITIPPLGWINVGHDHGVKVIGTVITEWADGIEFWEDMLQSEEKYKNFANSLVAIAKALKFDGWLLNIENKVEKPLLLLDFVQHLHAVLHQELPEPVLIWYDSVTVDGHLNWQNALNLKNKAFFDACDGLFTNYSWKPEDIKASREHAGARATDVYVGIDVWGRNFYGGGQFNVEEALEVGHKQGLSLAIFAPAWTHEAMSQDDTDVNMVALAEQLDVYEQFLLRDRALWDSIWRYLHTRLPTSLPFNTSFCRGQGWTRRLYGEVICPLPWYNLRHMKYQPNASHGSHGYLLSTIEHIMAASRTGILRDPKGIIKYRESFLESLKTEQQKADTDYSGKVDDMGADNEQTIEGSMKENTAELNKATNTSDAAGTSNVAGASNAGDDCSSKGCVVSDTKCPLKRKIKGVFSHLFRRSKERKEENELKTAQPLETKDIPASQVLGKLEVIPERSSEDVDKTSNEVKGESEEDLSKETPLLKREPSLLSGREARKMNLSKERIERERSISINLSKEEEQKLEDARELSEEFDLESRGRSMARMSINIQLKDKADKTRYMLACVPDELQCLEVYFDDSFIGGSCLKINPSDQYSKIHRQIRLFFCDFPCENSLIFCVVTKNLTSCQEQFLNLKIHMKNDEGEEAMMVLIGRDVEQLVHPDNSRSFVRNVSPVNSAKDTEFRDLQKYMLLHEPGFYIPIENSYDWKVRYYEVSMPNSRVLSIICNTGLAYDPILLGYLGICEKKKQTSEESNNQILQNQKQTRVERSTQIDQEPLGNSNQESNKQKGQDPSGNSNQESNKQNDQEPLGSSKRKRNKRKDQGESSGSSNQQDKQQDDQPT